MLWHRFNVLQHFLDMESTSKQKLILELNKNKVNMKTRLRINGIKYFLCVVLAVVFSGCTQQESISFKEEIQDNRIKLKESRVVKGERFMILEIDGKEYLTSSNGGIFEISK